MNQSEVNMPITPSTALKKFTVNGSFICLLVTFHHWSLHSRNTSLHLPAGRYSFILIHSFPLRRIAGEAALGRPKIPHDQQQSQIFLLAPHQEGTNQVQR